MSGDLDSCLGLEITVGMLSDIGVTGSIYGTVCLAVGGWLLARGGASKLSINTEAVLLGSRLSCRASD